MSKFSENLIALRKKAGLTQEELANKLSLTPQSISKYERDEAHPDIDYLIPLADALSCTVNELLGIEDIEYQEKRKPKKVNIKVSSQDGDDVNLNLPYLLVKGFSKTGLHLGSGDSNKLKDIDFDLLFEAAESGAFGKLLEVNDKDGDHIEIWVE